MSRPERFAELAARFENIPVYDNVTKRSAKGWGYTAFRGCSALPDHSAREVIFGLQNAAQLRVLADCTLAPGRLRAAATARCPD